MSDKDIEEIEEKISKNSRKYYEKWLLWGRVSCDNIICPIQVSQRPTYKYHYELQLKLVGLEKSRIMDVNHISVAQRMKLRTTWQ